MNFIQLHKKDGIATLTLSRGKVNALNDDVVDELRDFLRKLETDPDARAVILTGSGNFFSFGFDVPEFLSFSKERFTRYLVNFTDLYSYIFLYPKPVVAALNGHTIAGGCMLATACDHRVMVAEKAKISLNEINFGSAVFAGATEMLRFCTGSANAAEILYSGAMYSAEEALKLKLVDGISAHQGFQSAVLQVAADLAQKPVPAFSAIKSLLRGPIANDFIAREKQSIKEFVEIWYSPKTWENLLNIKIH